MVNKLLVFCILMTALLGVFAGNLHASENRFWEIQSIDTMKYSRDYARSKANDESFSRVIDNQVRLIAETGATHIAIGTPYDDEFLSFLKEWVKSARKYNLKVWFRGNLSGWEGWFGYTPISKDSHTSYVVDFIEANPEMFEDGDIFSSCPECENGVIGDPRSDVDVADYREFIITEYREIDKAFDLIDKSVASNFFSMNADVAYLVMDKDTTKALDGLVVIDHYIKDPDSYHEDINKIVERSRGKVVIGEFGAPIPNIHGRMTEKQQAEWVSSALLNMIDDHVLGINYWTSASGSTSLWTESLSEKPAASVIRDFYKPEILTLVVKNELGRAIKESLVSLNGKSFKADDGGHVVTLIYKENQVVTVESQGYIGQTISVNSLVDGEGIILIKESENLFFKLQKLIFRILNLNF